MWETFIATTFQVPTHRAPAIDHHLPKPFSEHTSHLKPTEIKKTSYLLPNWRNFRDTVIKP